MALQPITRPLHLARILICSVLLAATPFSTAHDFPFFHLNFGFQKKADSRKPDPGLVRVSIVSRITGGREIEINGRLITDFSPIITQSFSLAGIVLDKENVMTFLGYRWLDIHNNDLSIEVSKEGQKWKGTLVGIDQRNGIAVIKLAGANLRKTRICDDCELKDGATVMAPASPEASRLLQAQVVSIGADSGNLVGVQATPDSRELVMTVDRPFPDIGLPVLTSDHRVLGFIASQDPLGLSYVVHPISQLLSSAEKILKNKGDLFAGWLGLYLDPIAGMGRGVFVQDVEPDSPAHTAGLSHGDLLLKFNGQQVKDSGQFIELVEGSPVGSKASIEIVRQGSPITLHAQIAARKSAANRGRMSFNLPGAFGFPFSRVAPEPLPRNQRLLIGVNTILLDPPLAQVLQIPVQSGVLVTDVVKDSPAARSGILVGDVIVSIDGQAITDALAFISFLQTHQWNERVLLQVNRKGIELSIPVLISE